MPHTVFFFWHDNTVNNINIIVVKAPCNSMRRLNFVCSQQVFTFIVVNVYIILYSHLFNESIEATEPCQTICCTCMCWMFAWPPIGAGVLSNKQLFYAVHVFVRRVVHFYSGISTDTNVSFANEPSGLPIELSSNLKTIRLLESSLLTTDGEFSFDIHVASFVLSCVDQIHLKCLIPKRKQIWKLWNVYCSRAAHQEIENPLKSSGHPKRSSNHIWYWVFFGKCNNMVI